MKTLFLDTSVLVSAFWKQHPNFESSFQLMSLSKKKYKFITSNHALVEYYSVMTRLPVSVKFEPTLIYSLIQENIIPHFEFHSLSDNKFLFFLKQASIYQIQGGNIHDFFHFRVAQDRKVDTLVTWNTKDFLKFGEEMKIQKPDQIV
jgi:predicted nucleic acid-binding protein